MRTSSETAGRPIPSVQTAWGCLTTNLAVPGFGSLLAGRRVAGVLQAALGILGLVLTMVFGVRFVSWYISNWADLTSGDDPVTALGDLWLNVRWAAAGIGIFLFATLWALTTSLAVLRQAKANAQPQAQPPPPISGCG